MSVKDVSLTLFGNRDEAMFGSSKIDDPKDVDYRRIFSEAFSLPQNEQKRDKRDRFKNSYSGGGAMIAVYPSSEVAQRLAMTASDVLEERGLAPEDLHVTLLYLGKAVDLTEKDLAYVQTLLALVAAETPRFACRVSGLGRFNTPDEDGQVAVYASVDGKELHDVRGRIARLLPEYDASEHGFTPHITLAYVDASDEREVPVPPNLEWEVTEVCLVLDGVRIKFRLESA